MNRTEVVKALAKRCGLKEKEVSLLLRQLPQVIGEALARGEPVTIHGLGRFAVRHQRQRMGKNPRTGEPMVVSARNVPKFRATAFLKSKVASAHDPSE